MLMWRDPREKKLSRAGGAAAISPWGGGVAARGREQPDNRARRPPILRQRRVLGLDATSAAKTGVMAGPGGAELGCRSGLRRRGGDLTDLTHADRALRLSPPLPP